MHLAHHTCTCLERTWEGLAEPYQLGNGHHVHAHSARMPWPCSSKQGSCSDEVWQEEMGRGGVFGLFWSGMPSVIRRGRRGDPGAPRRTHRTSSVMLRALPIRCCSTTRPPCSSREGRRVSLRCRGPGSIAKGVSSRCLATVHQSAATSYDTGADSIMRKGHHREDLCLVFGSNRR
jgi:hypothetical protein